MWRRTCAIMMVLAAPSLLLFALIGGAQQQWDALEPADMVDIRGGEDSCAVTNWDSDCEGHPGLCNEVTPEPCEDIGGGVWLCINGNEWRLYPQSDRSKWPKCFWEHKNGLTGCQGLQFACWQETRCPPQCHLNPDTGEQECYYYSPYFRPGAIHNTYQASGDACYYIGS